MRGGCWVRAPLPAWGAGLRGGAGQGRAYPGAALRGWRHQSEGVIQEGVHLLSRLLDGGLGGHVGRWCWGRVKHLISRGGAAVVWGQVRVRLYERERREYKVDVQCSPDLIWLLLKMYIYFYLCFHSELYCDVLSCIRPVSVQSAFDDHQTNIFMSQKTVYYFQNVNIGPRSQN